MAALVLRALQRQLVATRTVIPGDATPRSRRDGASLPLAALHQRRHVALARRRA